MKKTTTIASLATLVLATAVAGPAFAALDEMRGADSMESFTKALIANFGPPGGVYEGSLNGENDLLNGDAALAPMTHFLSGGDVTTSAGLAVAVDQIVIVSSERATEISDTDDSTGPGGPRDDQGASLAFSGTITGGFGSYSLASSGSYAGGIDLLRVIFAGAENSLPAYNGSNTVAASAPVGPGVGCDSALRHHLQQNYNDILQGSPDGSGAANSCGTFYRDSATHDFLYRNDGDTSAAPTSRAVISPDASTITKYLTVDGTYATVANASGSPGTMVLAGQNGVFTSTSSPPSVSSFQESTGQHLFRPGDFSGVTNSFIELLGLVPTTYNATVVGAPDTSPFCNGTQELDGDPVRVSCNPEVDVCTNPSDLTTGWLQVISVPGERPGGFLGGDDLGLSQPDIYPTERCESGSFLAALRPIDVQTGGRVGSCPDGAPAFGNFCNTPTTLSGDFRCVNQANNRANGGITGSGRGFNAILRDAAGDVQLDSNGFPIVNANYRMSSRDETDLFYAPRSGPERDCFELDSARQIGCLSGLLECSAGLGTRSSMLPAEFPFGDQSEDWDVKAYALNDQAPRLPTLLPDPQTAVSATYPLNRKLYFNSVVGFDASGLGQMTAEEASLATVVMSDPVSVHLAAVANGYHPLTRALCQDFGGGADACAGLNLNEISSFPATSPVTLTGADL